MTMMMLPEYPVMLMQVSGRVSLSSAQIRKKLI